MCNLLQKFIDFLLLVGLNGGVWGDVSSNLTQFIGHIIARLESGFITESANFPTLSYLCFVCFIYKLFKVINTRYLIHS